MGHTQKTYPAESVGLYLVRNVPVASPGDPVSRARERIARAPAQWDSLTYVYVLDEHRKPVGVVPIETLYAAGSGTRLADIMQTEIASLTPFADREEAAITSITQGLDAVPVIDAEGRFIGAVDHDGILDILHREHVEDLLLRSGIRSGTGVVDVLAARVVDLIRLRLPWLILGLAGGMLATLVVNLFEGALERRLALAFFIPVVVYMSDAVGTQTETIFIRSLALRRTNLRLYLAHEAVVGLALGVVCGLLIAGFALVVFQSPDIAVIVGLAMFTSIFASVFIAVAIPWTFNHFGKDPAFGSGPFATVIQDILSLTVYFLIASAIILR